MRIRDERPEDIQTIYDLTQAAFKTMPYSAGDEQDLINALRNDGALMVSLVAERGDKIIGHVAFSRVKIDGQPGNWFDLGPVSVKPALQSLGIGSALIREGIKRIEAMGAEGCVLLDELLDKPPCKAEPPAPVAPPVHRYRPRPLQHQEGFFLRARRLDAHRIGRTSLGTHQPI